MHISTAEVAVTDAPVCESVQCTQSPHSLLVCKTTQLLLIRLRKFLKIKHIAIL